MQTAFTYESQNLVKLGVCNTAAMIEPISPCYSPPYYSVHHPSHYMYFPISARSREFFVACMACVVIFFKAIPRVRAFLIFSLDGDFGFQTIRDDFTHHGESRRCAGKGAAEIMFCTAAKGVDRAWRTVTRILQRHIETLKIPSRVILPLWPNQFSICNPLSQIYHSVLILSEYHVTIGLLYLTFSTRFQLRKNMVSFSTIKHRESQVELKECEEEKHIDNSDHATPASSEHYSQGWNLVFTIFPLCLSTLLVTIDNTIIAVAISMIASTFKALNEVAWYGSASLLSVTALQLTYGKVYKYFDVKFIYLLSIAVFEDKLILETT